MAKEYKNYIAQQIESELAKRYKKKKREQPVMTVPASVCRGVGFRSPRI